MITAKSLINQTITLIIDNGKQIITAKSDHPRWQSIRAAFAAGNDALLESLVSIKSVIESYSTGLLSVNSAGVTYNGRAIHRLDSQRVMAFLKNNMDYKPLANYMEKLAQNPSSRSIQEAYKFQEHLGLTLTDAGNVIAFKGISSNDFSVFGNLDTVVLQGEVNSSGQIKNSIGATIEVERSSVDDDYTHECSHGLHAGSMAYAKGHGNKVVLVEINPSDFVSVPSDCNFQKLRCSKYKVVGNLEEYLPLIYTNEHTTKPVKVDTSKFANDSHKKLKRDGSGRFIKVGTEVTFESYDTTNTFKTTIDESGDDVIDWVEPIGNINNLTHVKSKFANDSHKSQERDSKGHFIRKVTAQDCCCGGDCDSCDK